MEPVDAGGGRVWPVSGGNTAGPLLVVLGPGRLAAWVRAEEMMIRTHEDGARSTRENDARLARRHTRHGALPAVIQRPGHAQQTFPRAICGGAQPRRSGGGVLRVVRVLRARSVTLVRPFRAVGRHP
jgi:hypothetical protein